MNTISLQKVSDNTLCSSSPYEPLFEHVAAHLRGLALPAGTAIAIPASAARCKGRSETAIGAYWYCCIICR